MGDSIKEGEAAVPQHPPGAAGVATAIYDHQATLSALGGDEATARLLLEKFVELLPETREAIIEASGAGDRQRLYEVVHKLAGSSSIVSAPAINGEARGLQRLLKQPSPGPEQVEEAVALLLDEIECFAQQAPQLLS